MPVTESAKKALRKDRRRAIVNQKIRHQAKQVLKRAQKSPTPKLISQASSILDRAAKKKVIHPNKAARLKSNLARLSKKRGPSKSKKKA